MNQKSVLGGLDNEQDFVVSYGRNTRVVWFGFNSCTGSTKYACTDTSAYNWNSGSGSARPSADSGPSYSGCTNFSNPIT
jgi:hypothetical protein